MSREEGAAIPEAGPVFTPPTAEELSAMLPQYEISHLIASGGMGAVYKGTQKALERPVAIKILPPEAARDGEAIGRFRTEARAMARLTHPSIPAVYDFDVARGYCYFAMELVEGNNVFHLIRQGNLSPERALEIFCQVCDALHFAHLRGITHGDIKPANILVNAGGAVKLADFGLAQLMDHNGRSWNDGAQEAWSPMGTPEYAAPELFIKGAAVGPPADIYSLGPVLYEMLTGAPPQGRFELPARALKLDPRIDAVISTCMQTNPGARFPTAEAAKEVAEAILRRMRERGRERPVKIVRPQAAARGAGQPVSRKTGTRPGSGRIFFISAMVVAAAVAVVLLFQREGKTPPDIGDQRPARESDFIRPNPKPPEREPAPAPPVKEPEPEPDGTVSGTPDGSNPEPPDEEFLSPPPEPAPSGELRDPGGASPALRGKLDELLAKHREMWLREVETPRQSSLKFIKERYLQALSRLDAEYLSKNDAANLLKVRTEEERFQAAPFAPVPHDKISSTEKLQKLQKTLNEEIQRVGEAAERAGEEVRRRYLKELQTLEEENAAGSTEDRKAVSEALDAAPKPDGAASFFKK